MKKSDVVKYSLLNALGIVLYVIVVISILFNARFNEWFSEALEPLFFGPILFLLLFVTSATITALLMFGRPVLLYLNGAKKEAITMILYTIGWLISLMLILALVAYTVGTSL